ncbi:hypothetical protein X798_00940 [Onchocerca flexuosa]|uniref:Uncharacterized protein n=1 Tax=Onchocerca flexuosa TaxID=387005 RepID=A0A238C3X3_9BILA|nr:hypothetical protein X798_00940 [Onchocerca flexuosa]
MYPEFIRQSVKHRFMFYEQYDGKVNNPAKCLGNTKALPHVNRLILRRLKKLANIIRPLNLGECLLLDFLKYQ